MCRAGHVGVMLGQWDGIPSWGRGLVSGRGYLWLGRPTELGGAKLSSSSSKCALVGRWRWATGRAACGRVGGETKVTQNLFRDVGVGQEGNDAHRSGAAWTATDIDLVDALEQLGPGQAGRPVGVGRWRGQAGQRGVAVEENGRRRGRAEGRGLTNAGRTRAASEGCASACAGGEDAVIASLVHAGRRDESACRAG